MATSFVFSVASDTLNGAVSARKLDLQIRTDPSIPIELSGVLVSGDALTITFQSDLSPTQETQLATLVGAHDGVALAKVTSIMAVRSDGALRVVQEPSNKDNLLQVKGFGFTATGPADAPSTPQVTNFYITPDVSYDIQGVQSIWVINDAQHANDYVVFSVVFPSGGAEADWDSLGLGTWPFSPDTTAPSDVVLKTFGDCVYIPPGGLTPIVADGTQTITPPLKLRFDYYAHTVSTDVEVRGNLRWWRFST